MSEFRAHIVGDLDLTQAESKLSNFQKSAKDLKIDIKIDENSSFGKFMKSFTGQAQSAGKSAGASFANSFNSGANKIKLNNAKSQIAGMQKTLSSLKFDKSSISNLTQDLESMNIAVKKVSTDMNGNGGNLRIHVSGTDELGRAVTVVKEFDTATQRFRTVSTNISSSFQDIAKAAQKAREAMSTGGIDADISKLTSSFKKLQSTGSPALNEIESEIKELKSLSASMATSTNDEDLANYYNQYSQHLKTAKNGMSALRAESSTTEKSFTGILSKVGKFATAYASIYSVINVGKQMAQNASEIDMAMSNLYRVTDLSAAHYDSIYSGLEKSANKYGLVLSDLINDTADWSKLGFDADVASSLAEISERYAVVGDMDSGTAVKNLVTAYKGFQDQLTNLYSGDQVSAISYVSDIFNELGNNFATDAASAGEALTNCASAMEAAGNSIQETSAISLWLCA